MLRFKQYLTEAKFDNTLNIQDIYNFAKKHENDILSNLPKEVEEALNHFESRKTSNPKVYIFSKSIAYRIGKGSIKSISGFKDGFKHSFKNSNDEIFNPELFKSSSKLGKVVRFALLIALKYPSSILTEEDKSEKQETEETIRTISSIKKLLDNLGKDHILIRLGRSDYKIDGFRQIDGRPKADMAFTYKGEDQIYVSHKLGRGPGDFQQYGGLSSDLGYLKNKRESQFVKEPSRSYIKQFLENIDLILEKVYNLKPDSKGMFDLKKTPRGTNFAQVIENDTVAGLVMFGKNYGSKDLGLDNVHILIDGNIEFKLIESGVYKLDGTYHSMINPTVIGSNDKFPKKAPYQPMLFVMRSESQGLKQGGFLNARAVIWPRNKVVEKYYQKFLRELRQAERLI